MSIRIAATSGLLALVLVIPASAHAGSGITVGTIDHAALGLAILHGGTSSSHWVYDGMVSGTIDGLAQVAGEMTSTSAGIPPSCSGYRIMDASGTVAGHTVNNLSGENVNGTLTLTGNYTGHSIGVVTIVLDVQYSPVQCVTGSATGAPASGPLALL